MANRKVLFFILLVLFTLHSLLTLGQSVNLRSMSWGHDYNLHVSLSNDSSYVMDVRGLYHESGKHTNPFLSETTTYFPVSLDREFVAYLREHPVDSSYIAQDSVPSTSTPYLTLWSALHHKLGGGYAHLINCIVYALEGGQLHLQDTALRRPITTWRPEPPTETYLRTKEWRYYIPTNQKEAHKEYKRRKQEGTLQDLQGIPEKFVHLFLKTSDRGYRKLAINRKENELAQIDLVRMMLGAKYLGERQIRHISQCVRDAVAKYTAKSLPSVIVFDDYKAAVAMALDSTGYRVDYVVFQEQNKLSEEEIKLREANIRLLIHNINLANEKLFRDRLSRYYE